jgi:hypothetical protein
MAEKAKRDEKGRLVMEETKIQVTDPNKKKKKNRKEMRDDAAQKAWESSQDKK